MAAKNSPFVFSPRSRPNTSDLVTRRAAVLLFLLYLATAFILTHLPGGNLPNLGWTRFIPNSDKFVHAGLYFFLAAFLANCLRFRLKSNRVVAGLTMTILAMYAAFDEWSQRFSPNRGPDFYDFVADMIGAWLGVSIFAVWRWIRRRYRTYRLAPVTIKGEKLAVEPETELALTTGPTHSRTNDQTSMARDLSQSHTPA
jgi:VanZ family protein